jgi:arylformamidase
MRLYRDFTDQEAIDAEYNPSARVADAGERMADWQRRSAATVAALEGRLGVRYGPTLAEHVDIFPAGAGAPVHIFVHGGYWRRFAARDFAWVAEPLVARGITAVIVNYALCPTVSMTEIVRQTRAAVAWTHAGIQAFGGDPARLTISGHSAGGHLVAMVLATDWPGTYGLHADLLKGAVALSGLFDLRPFPFSYLQPALQLTTAEVLALSPIDLEPQVLAPLTVAVGGAESAEFRRQSRDFAERWAGQGVPCRHEEIPGADHFTALDALFAAEGPLLGRLVDWSFAG